MEAKECTANTLQPEPSIRSVCSCETKHEDKRTDPLIDCEKAKKSCSVLSQEPFAATCHAKISPDSYVKACTDTLCKYPAADNLPCQFLEAYTRACNWLTKKKVDGWRSTSNCPSTPKAFCQDTVCASNEFCTLGDSGSHECLCRPISAKTHRDDGTLVISVTVSNSPSCAAEYSGGPTVCVQNTASASLINCLLREKGIDYTTLHLLDPKCKGTLDDGLVTFEFSSSDMCGAVVTNEAKQVVYKNTIMAANPTGVIDRQGGVNIDFSCNHNQPTIKTLNFKIKSK
ncbi:uncharacterized protein LOC117808825 [Xyrichtys novacula]|uniref:Uncharacterized protein LOC117808825 n=1 Tax=Xyrichtys novacula TaxID=13765 RepID=A0AAV1G4M9_XYRNO|nr:uncharacterized protein LOC117808825 [Xyrichtys novacula]